jgi:hypothetical protein
MKIKYKRIMQKSLHSEKGLSSTPCLAKQSKSNGNKNTVLFSYLAFLLIVSPLIRNLSAWFHFSFLFTIFLSLVCAYLIGEALKLLDSKYHFVKKVLQNAFFQYFIFYCVFLENVVRKNVFFFGIAFFLYYFF